MNITQYLNVSVKTFIVITAGVILYHIARYIMIKLENYLIRKYTGDIAEKISETFWRIHISFIGLIAIIVFSLAFSFLIAMVIYGGK
jgi:hypothetical protein